MLQAPAIVVQVHDGLAQELRVLRLFARAGQWSETRGGETESRQKGEIPRIVLYLRNGGRRPGQQDCQKSRTASDKESDFHAVTSRCVSHCSSIISSHTIVP